MNIPDEVMRSASQAWSATLSGSPESEGVNPALAKAYEAEYQVIAEWARREALREAGSAVRSGAIEELKNRLNASRVEFRKGYAEGAMDAGVSIRSLAEGGN